MCQNATAAWLWKGCGTVRQIHTAFHGRRSPAHTWNFNATPGSEAIETVRGFTLSVWQPGSSKQARRAATAQCRTSVRYKPPRLIDFNVHCTAAQQQLEQLQCRVTQLGRATCEVQHQHSANRCIVAPDYVQARWQRPWWRPSSNGLASAVRQHCTRHALLGVGCRHSTSLKQCSATHGVPGPCRDMPRDKAGSKFIARAARKPTPTKSTSCASVGFYGAHGAWHFTRGHTRRAGR